MPVGGHQGQPVGVELHQHPGEDRPGLVAAGRHRRLGHRRRQRRPVHLDPRPRVARRQRGELDGIDAVDVGPMDPAHQAQHLSAGVELEGAGGVEQRPHVLGQQPGRDGGPPLAGNLRRNGDADGQIEVGCREPQTLVACLDQHVAQDRQGGTR